MKQAFAAALVVSALALTSACGGGNDRPSKSEVSKSITGKDSVFGSSIPKAAASCIAGVLVDSKLSDKTLNAILDGDKGYKGSKSEQKVLSDLTSDLARCVTK